MKTASKSNVSSPPLVICERTGEWAEAMRRAAARACGSPISIVETRSPAECRKRLGERRSISAGLPLAVELSPASAPEFCELLSWHARRFGDAPRIVVARREAAAYEAVVREAGATLFLVSPRNVVACVKEYLRYRDDPSHVSFGDPRSFLERLRDSLPWRPLRGTTVADEM